MSSVLSSFFKKKIFDTLMVLIKYYLFINLFLEFGTYLLPAVMFWLDTQVCWVNVDESTSCLLFYGILRDI